MEKGIDTIKVDLSQCCCPIPGDEIIGYISRGKGVKVHRKSCSTLKNLPQRFIDVEWDSSVIDNVLHQVDLIIRASDRIFIYKYKTKEENKNEYKY